MKRSTVGLMLVLLLTVGTSARAQEELDSLNIQLSEVTERFGAVEDQYGRVLEQFGFPGGLIALRDLDENVVGDLVSSTAERLEARTPGKGSAFVNFWIGADRLLGIGSTLRRTFLLLVDTFRQGLNEDLEEETIKSIQTEVQRVRANLFKIKGELLEIQAVLNRIESELATL